MWEHVINMKVVKKYLGEAIAVQTQFLKISLRCAAILLF